jgi:hypothetical protein
MNAGAKTLLQKKNTPYKEKKYLFLKKTFPSSRIFLRNLRKIFHR